MPITTIDLGQITFTRTGLLTEVRSTAVVEVGLDEVSSSHASAIGATLAHRDTWCVRSAHVAISLTIGVDPSMCLAAASNRQSRFDIMSLLSKAKIWRQLGLQLRVQHSVDSSLDQFDRGVLVHAELIDPGMERDESARSLHSIDLTDVRCPRSVLKYRLLSISTSWQFANAPKSRRVSHTLKRHQAEEHMLDPNTLSTAISDGFSLLIGLPTHHINVAEAEDTMKLITLAPSTFRHGYGQQITQRVKLFDSVADFLNQYMRYRKKRRKDTAASSSEVRSVYGSEDHEAVSHNLWSTMTTVLASRPSKSRTLSRAAYLQGDVELDNDEEVNIDHVVHLDIAEDFIMSKGSDQMLFSDHAEQSHEGCDQPLLLDPGVLAGHTDCGKRATRTIRQQTVHDYISSQWHTADRYYDADGILRMDGDHEARDLMSDDIMSDNASLVECTGTSQCGTELPNDNFSDVFQQEGVDRDQLIDDACDSPASLTSDEDRCQAPGNAASTGHLLDMPADHPAQGTVEDGRITALPPAVLQPEDAVEDYEMLTDNVMLIESSHFDVGHVMLCGIDAEQHEPFWHDTCDELHNDTVDVDDILL